MAASVAFSQNRCVCCLSRVEKPEFCQLEASTQKRYSHDVQKLAHKVTNDIIRFMYRAAGTYFNMVRTVVLWSQHDGVKTTNKKVTPKILSKSISRMPMGSLVGH